MQSCLNKRIRSNSFANDNNDQMKVIIKREKDLVWQHYCIMEFKGKFESDEPLQNCVHVGELIHLEGDEYLLQMGVMDLVGKAVAMDAHCLYTEVQQGPKADTKIILVKGIITKKILFEKRPVPNMQRAENHPTATHYHLFN